MEGQPPASRSGQHDDICRTIQNGINLRVFSHTCDAYLRIYFVDLYANFREKCKITMFRHGNNINISNLAARATHYNKTACDKLINWLNKCCCL